MRRRLLTFATLLGILMVGAIATVAQAWLSCLPSRLLPAAAALPDSRVPFGIATSPGKVIDFLVLPEPTGECWQFQVVSISDDVVAPSAEPSWSDLTAARGPTLGWPAISSPSYLVQEHRSGWPMRSMVWDITTTMDSANPQTIKRAQYIIRVPFGTASAPSSLIVPGAIIPAGFAANAAFFSSPIWLPFLVWTCLIVPLRRLARRRQGRCPDCGYDPGTPTTTCPECGRQLTPPASPSLPQSPTQVSDS